MNKILVFGLSVYEHSIHGDTTGLTSQHNYHGVQYRDLYAWRDNGLLIELSRGVFRRVDAPEPTFPDFLAISRRAPGAIVCCLSAAFVYDLTDDIPIAVQIAIPQRDHIPVIDFPAIEVFQISPDRFELGATHMEAAPGEEFRIYSAPRTVVDLMRFRRRFGLNVANVALVRYLQQPDAEISLLLGMARKLNVLAPMRTALDVALAQ